MTNILLEREIEGVRKQEKIPYHSINPDELEIASLTGKIMAFLTLYNITRENFGMEKSIEYLRNHKNELKNYILELNSAIGWFESQHYRKMMYAYEYERAEELEKLERILEEN